MMLCKYRSNNIFSVIRSEDAVTEPVTLDEVKASLAITFIDDDALLTALISQCRDGVEMFCNVSMVAHTITMDADLYEQLELPYGPVNDLTSVSLKTDRATYTAQASDTYDLDGVGFKLFSVTQAGRYRVVYAAGPYAPQSLKLDLLRIIGYCYEHRGDEALTSLQSGQARPKGLDEALELFASKYQRMAWL